MKNYCLAQRIIVVVILAFMISTFFMPIISVDEYKEYTFESKTTDYSKEYQSSTTPKANKISALTMCKVYFYGHKQQLNVNRENTLFVRDLNSQLARKEITQEEYDVLLANNENSNVYLMTQYSFRADYRLASGTFALLCACIIMYVAIIAVFIIAFINIFKNKQNLYSANSVLSWVMTGVILLAMVIIFLYYAYTETYITEKKVTEILTICGSPKTLMFVNFFLGVFLSIFCPINTKTFNVLNSKKANIPDFVSYKKPRFNYYKSRNHHSSRGKYKL